jgi:hypothetical protein
MINLQNRVLTFAKDIINQPKSLFLQHDYGCGCSTLVPETFQINIPRNIDSQAMGE